MQHREDNKWGGGELFVNEVFPASIPNLSKSCTSSWSKMKLPFKDGDSERKEAYRLISTAHSTFSVFNQMFYAANANLK